MCVINGSRCCNCSLVALLVPVVCFLPAKARKHLNILRCIQVLDLVLKCYSDKKEVILISFFYLQCVDDQSCIINSKWILSFLCQVLDWNCLLWQFYGKVCAWIPEPVWLRMDWLGVFLLKCASTVIISAWTRIFKNCSSVSLFWRHEIFPIVNSSGILVCSLIVLLFFSQWVH